MKKPVDALFTTDSLLSLQGATLAAWLAPTVLGHLFGGRFGKSAHKWTAFAVSMGLAFMVAYTATDAGSTKWIVALFNGLLIFASATGINQFAASTQANPAVGRAAGARRPLITSWF